MVEFRNDPSMDEILASIKRIIAEDGATAVATAAASTPMRATIEEAAQPVMPESDPEPDDDQDEVLELTEALSATDSAAAAAAEDEPLILSMDAAAATQNALSSLSSLLMKPKPGEQTLDGLVRDMLRPLLKEWLDANLPRMVEDMVRREIKRITGQG